MKPSARVLIRHASTRAMSTSPMTLKMNSGASSMSLNAVSATKEDNSLGSKLWKGYLQATDIMTPMFPDWYEKFSLYKSNSFY